MHTIDALYITLARSHRHKSLSNVFLNVITFINVFLNAKTFSNVFLNVITFINVFLNAKTFSNVFLNAKMIGFGSNLGINDTFATHSKVA